MKPICARCNLFLRMIRAGEYFEERMPGPGGAKRPVLAEPEAEPDHAHMVRCIAGSLTRVVPGELAGWQPYKLWVGDVWECRGCGAQVIVGVPPNPLAEHFDSEYAKRVAQVGGVKRHIDDC
jgi:hypothetical protein